MIKSHLEDDGEGPTWINQGHFSPIKTGNKATGSQSERLRRHENEKSKSNPNIHYWLYKSMTNKASRSESASVFLTQKPGTRCVRLSQPYSIIRPFQQNPLTVDLITSPINTTEKKGSPVKRRIIMDLSFPHGKSINAGIDKDVYLNEHIELQFPSVDNIIEQIHRVGPGVLMFKSERGPLH